MDKFIIEEFEKRNPDLIIHAPSRINLINPLDAVEADSWMPAVAIEGKSNPLSVFLYLKEIEKKNEIKIYEIEKIKEKGRKIYKLNLKKKETLVKEIGIIKRKFNDDLRLIYASLYRIYLENSLLWEKIKKTHMEIGIISTIPRQSGLGGSSAIIIAFIYALAEFHNFFNKTENLKKSDLPINKDTIAEICTKVEDKDLKITAGYSDRYVISRGGLSFCSYIGKLYHHDIGKEPLAVYDRIDKIYDIESLPIIICFSGSSHDSGDLHKKLRTLYLKRNQRIVKKYGKLAEIAWKARFSLMEKDWKSLGLFFKENTRIMNKIMEIAGFQYGIGLANNILIDLIQDHPEVYAAKLTGAGGGGSVFALVNPDFIEDIFNYWKKSLNELIMNKEKFTKKFPSYPIDVIEELKSAQFFQIKLNTTGVKKI